jgi:hypothetical protein
MRGFSIVGDAHPLRLITHMIERKRARTIW